MHPVDVLSYGNATVLRAVSDLPAADWDTAGVCGWWSVREIVAHLASFEHILIEALEMAGGARRLWPHPTRLVPRRAGVQR
ncbi:MAG: maleylpyruvate isomerase N-terminal domain-containing protein [Candidatus Promineofilum sp.]|nr:maleylpyruvate isomerase N-terminal domain-containing protein [Promineifilum sp.]